MNRLPVHDITSFWPTHSAKHIAALTADIKANGVRVPLVGWKNPEEGGKLVIINGRHRAAIAERLGVDYQTREFVGTAAEMIKHVAELNAAERSLSDEQRQSVAFKVDGFLAAITKTPNAETGLRSTPANIDPPKGKPTKAKPSESARTPQGRQDGQT